MVKKVIKTKKLNKFEITRLLSARAYELSKGAKSKVEIKKKGALLGNDYVHVAEKELKTEKLELDIYK